MRTYWIHLLCLACTTISGCSIGTSLPQATPPLLLMSALTTTPASMTKPPTIAAPLPSLTPWPTSTTPTLTLIPSKPYFIIGDTSFRFVGAFVPGWFWGPENSGEMLEETAEDLIVSAKASGISVFHLMPPGYGCYPETCLEEFLSRLDIFLDIASKHGIYIMLPFVNGWGLSMQPEAAYYNPLGTEGLMTDEALEQAFKNRIKFIINRQNTINGRNYRDDPTIMAWLIIEEPFYFNRYQDPTNPPAVTLPQVAAWFDEMASYVKSLDPNHLVSIMFTGGVEQIDSEKWDTMFDSPSLDFLEFEDDAKPVENPADYPYDVSPATIKLLSLDKPVVTMLAPPDSSLSGPTCLDVEWQANFVHTYAFPNLDAGVAGIVIHLWMSDLIPIPAFDICRAKTDSMTPYRNALLNLANQLNIPGYPNPPLDFVRISRG
jgi:hypothetical protein